MAAAPLVLSEIRGLREALSAALPKLRFEFASPTSVSAEMLARATVVIADPPSFAALAPRAASLRWCQSTFAGVNALLSPLGEQAPPTYACTRLAGVMGAQMAEYVAQHILNLEREHADLAAAQRRAQWVDSAWDAGARRPLSSLTLGVLGAGDLGGAIARSLKAGFGMKTLGLRTKPQLPVAGFDELVGSSRSELASLLARADYVVNVLPSTERTRGLLGGDALKTCARDGVVGEGEGEGEREREGEGRGVGDRGRAAVLINVGRGDVLSEREVVNALDQGWLSHAVLDVFEMEPLPADSALWRHEKVTGADLLLRLLLLRLLLLQLLRLLFSL